MKATRTGNGIALAAILLPLLAAATAADPGVLYRSDGTSFEGDVTWTRGQPLRLHDPNLGKWYSIQPGEPLRIRSIVTREASEKAWVWVEDGRQEKIYTGETYPVRDVVTEVTLRSGAVYRGDCRTVLYVKDAQTGRKKRFFLKSSFKGEKGQTQDDIVHVTEVRFEGEEGGPSRRPSLLLKIEGLPEIESVHGIERSLDLHFEGRKTGEGWLLGGLVPGTYDVIVVARGGVRLWMQATPGADRKRPSPKDEQAVAARVSEVEDFFPEHRMLTAVGGRKKARALVLKKRTGATSMSAEGERLFRRLEIWTLHYHGERWYVDGRVMLYREHGDPFDLQHARPVEEDSRLGGHVLSEGRKTVELNLAAPEHGRDGKEARDGR